MQTQAAAQEKLDEAAEAFIKLRQLQPKQQALQAKLDQAGSLDEDSQEELDFIADEISRLIEVLQAHGFQLPECAASMCARTSSCASCLRMNTTRACSPATNALTLDGVLAGTVIHQAALKCCGIMQGRLAGVSQDGRYRCAVKMMADCCPKPQSMQHYIAQTGKALKTNQAMVRIWMPGIAGKSVGDKTTALHECITCNALLRLSLMSSLRIVKSMDLTICTCTAAHCSAQLLVCSTCFTNSQNVLAHAVSPSSRGAHSRGSSPSRPPRPPGKPGRSNAGASSPGHAAHTAASMRGSFKGSFNGSPSLAASMDYHPNPMQDMMSLPANLQQPARRGRSFLGGCALAGCASAVFEYVDVLLLRRQRPSAWRWPSRLPVTNDLHLPFVCTF